MYVCMFVHEFVQVSVYPICTRVYMRVNVHASRAFLRTIFPLFFHVACPLYFFTLCACLIMYEFVHAYAKFCMYCVYILAYCECLLDFKAAHPT